MRADLVYLRTKEHPVIHALKEEGVLFEAFDSVYEKYERFDQVYEEISEILLRKAETESVVYAVPGHPLVLEKTVQLLITKGKEAGNRD